MFVGFTFASEVLLGSLARFYGVSIPEGHNETSLAEFVRTRLPNDPTLGDRISFGGIGLVVGGMSGDKITRIGLDLGSMSACPS
jgi:NhaP-type Na+/H+ and K+/H+ antiporter